MSKIDKIMDKITNFFFEEDTLTEEERRKEDRSVFLFISWMTSLTFVFLSIITIHTFFKGHLNIYDISGVAILGITICTGLGGLYFDSKVKKYND
jgi:hypothetical protein